MTAPSHDPFVLQPAMGVPVLAVQNLTGPVGRPVIRDVNLSLPQGQTHVVLGGIHSGKTMLLRHIVGLERAISGTIAIEGEVFRATGEPAEVLRHMRTRCGVVFEGAALLSRLSVVENVELPLLEHGGEDPDPEEVREAARELLAEVGLASIDLDSLPAQLGRAAQRRVALARALALRPPVLLLDEPTQGLDAHAAAELDDTIVQLQARHGFGTLILSHEVRHAYGAARQIYVIADGVIAGAGDRASLMASENPAVQRLLLRRGRRP